MLYMYNIQYCMVIGTCIAESIYNQISQNHKHFTNIIKINGVEFMINDHQIIQLFSFQFHFILQVFGLGLMLLVSGDTCCH